MLVKLVMNLFEDENPIEPDLKMNLEIDPKVNP